MVPQRCPHTQARDDPALGPTWASSSYLTGQGLCGLEPRPPFLAHALGTWGPGIPGPNRRQPAAGARWAASRGPSVRGHHRQTVTAGGCASGSQGWPRGGCLRGALTAVAREHECSLQLSQCGINLRMGREGWASDQKPARSAAVFQVTLKAHLLRLENRTCFH